MADSADAEELDAHFQGPVSSRTRRLNIADNGKVVNAATDGIQIGEQKVDIAGAAKEVNMDDRSTRVANTQNSANNSINVFHFSGGPPYDSMSRPFPKDDSGAFIYSLKRTNLIPPTSNYQPTWDETHENFSDPRELARQRVNTFTLWHDTKVTDTMHGVETAVFNFCQQRGLKSRSSKKLSWTRTKENIRRASSRARKYYKQDYLLQDQMVDLLRNINDFLTSDNELQFLGWLDWLPEDSHRRCLADSVGYILVAVEDCYPFNRPTIGYLENILSLFSKSTEYVQLCRERRPTADMPATTVYIFTQTAELLTSLLDYDLIKTQEKGKHSKQIQTTIDRLGRTLDDINHSARVKLRGGGRVRKPSEDDDNAELQLYTTVHNLCREVPAIYEARATAYFTRQMSKIASDSPQRGLSTDSSSDARQSTTEDIISKEQALDALSFRGSDNKRDIDDCLKYAEVSGHEKAQLAVLTREDAF